MRIVYPSPSAKRGTVLNDNRGKKHVYYCKQCGFPCDYDTTFVAKDGDASINTITITTEDDQPSNIAVTKGCPFCGTTRSR
uniref:Uncharacterized protein n=1 Tax=viral metagenome TaxID=1070528 RepID=A0A6H1ZVU0_9ZZZZ